MISLFCNVSFKSKVLHGNDLSYIEKQYCWSKRTLMFMKGEITEMKATPVKFQRVYTHGGQQKCKTEIRSSPSLYVIFFFFAY